MRRYLNLDTFELQERPDFAFPIEELIVKRGDSFSFEMPFVRNGAFQDVDPAGTATLKFGAKVAGTFDSSYVFFSADWTKTRPQYFGDAITTEDETELTSATAAFTADDVGLVITGAGIPDDTIIASVESATEITLSRAATATGAGVDIRIARETLYTVNPSLNTTKGNNLLGYDPDGFAEVTEVRCLRDTDSSLQNKYWVMSDAAGTVGVWFNVDGSGAVPAGATACDRQIGIAIVENDSAATIAAAIATTLEADAAFSAVASGSLVTITDAEIGDRDDAEDGDTDFGISTWIQGSAPNTLEAPEDGYVDLDCEIEWTIGAIVTSSKTFTLRVYFDVNNGSEGVPSDANPAYPLPGVILTNEANGSVSKSGRTAITNGAETVAVAFASNFDSAPRLAGMPAVEKGTGSDDNVWCTGISDLGVSGFTAYLSGAVSNGNYKLHWLAYQP